MDQQLQQSEATCGNRDVQLYSSDCWRATVTVPPVLAFMDSLGILHLDGMTATVATGKSQQSERL
ncbi:hypothetical protein E4U50_003680 [Claviceps purpurea]|nr:hypothetical protein E4U50_003680 [Claviceps purpurea]